MIKLPENRLKIKDLRFKKKNLSLFIGSCFVLLLASYVLLLQISRAQELQRTITLINPSVSATLNPGQTTEGTTAIINESNFPLTFNVGVQDYIVVDTHGTPNLLPPNTLDNKYSAASWIAVYPSTFTVKPGERQPINYYIKVPSTAAPCGHYAAIVYTPTASGAQGTGTTVETQLGSLFYITVNGTCKISAAVTKFSAPGFQEYGPVNVLTEIKNNGDLHIKPTGTITLSGIFGNSTYKFPGANIFPQASRDYQNTVGEGFMIGQYKAELLASYGTNNNLPLTATVYFWVFPWRLTLVIVLVLIALILGIMYIRKRRNPSSRPEQDGSKTTDEVKTEATTKADEKTAEEVKTS